MRSASEKSWEASEDYKKLFRDFMVKASDPATNQNIKIYSKLSFTFKRALPETAKVVEGERLFTFKLDKDYATFENISHMSDCEKDKDKNFEFNLKHFLPQRVRAGQSTDVKMLSLQNVSAAPIYNNKEMDQ
jgi:hypothetical protein